MGEVVGGGLEEFPSSPDQVHRLLFLDGHLNLIIGVLASFEGPKQEMMKSSVQLTRTSEDQPVLRNDLPMTGEFLSTSEEKSLGNIKATIVGA